MDSAIAALLSGAPGALDTLNELAAALGDDANFATTILNAIASHEAENATETTKGHVLLQTNVDASESKALTPKALKNHQDDMQAHSLTNNITLYVATTGSDTTGDGSSGNPFATINQALSVIPKNMGNYTATISLAAGSYAGFSIASYSRPITINITGNVTITSEIEIIDGSRLVISGSYNLTIHPSTDTTAISVNSSSTLYITTSAVVLNGQNLGNFTIFSLARDNSVINIDPPCISITLSNIAYRAFLATGGGMIRFGYQVAVGGNIAGVWYVASGGIIFVNSHTGTGGTKILKEFGGMVKTGAGVDLT